MASLVDRNILEQRTQPPFYLSALYVALAFGKDGKDIAKVGAADRQSMDVGHVLMSVRSRIQCVVPRQQIGGVLQRPETWVWVVLTTRAAVRHELEQRIVDDLGDRRWDPTQGRKREYVDPAALPRVFELIDTWRNDLPDFLSETLWSYDSGQTFSSPKALLPFAGITTGMAATGVDEAVSLASSRYSVLHWRERGRLRSSIASTQVTGISEKLLVRGHDSRRGERFIRALSLEGGGEAALRHELAIA